MPDGAKPDPAESYGAVMVFGGSMHPDQDDRFGWLASEEEFLRDVLSARIPVFGVCLGAQMLARAAGGTVKPASEPEIGWLDVSLTPAGTRRPRSRRASADGHGLPVAPLHVRDPAGRNGARAQRDLHAGVPARRPARLGHPVPRRGDAPDGDRVDGGRPGRTPDAPGGAARRVRSGTIERSNAQGRALADAFLARSDPLAQSAGTSRDHSCQEPT